MTYFIIIRGPLACGKSTIAKRLAGMIKAKVFHVDDILAKHKLEDDKEEGYISQKSFLKANEIIIPLIIEQLEKGVNVIVEGNFYWKSQVEDLLKKLKYKKFVFTLKLPVKICIERDIARGTTHGSVAAEVVYAKVSEFDYGINIDANKNIDEVVAEILNCIK